MNPSRGKIVLTSGAFVLFALLVYAPLLRAEFAIDDSLWVTDNTTLRNLSGLKQIWLERNSAPQYCPLVSTAFWIQYRLWGLNPSGYHLTNILLHSLNAILLWLILGRLSLRGASFAAALFLVHPLQVESLAWVSELKNILSAFFSFAAFYFYLEFNPPDPGDETKPPKWSRYFLSTFLFACALLSKTTATTVPAAVLLIYWWKRNRLLKRDVLYMAAWFLLAAAGSAMAVSVEKYLYELDSINAYYITAGGKGAAFSIAERALIAGRALWFYVGKLFYPLGLTCFYERWRIDVSMWRQYVYPAAAIAAPTALFLLRKRIGRGPLTAILFFGGTLAPVTGIVDFAYMLYSFVADHFQYTACVGLFALFSSFGADLFAKRDNSRELKWALATTALVMFGALSFIQSGYYENRRALWTNNILNSPNSAVAQYNIGNHLMKQGEFNRAVFYFRRAIEIWPGYAEAQNSLGFIFDRQGKPDEALSYFREAVRINPGNPKAQANLGYALAEMGKYDEAIEHLNEALRINPNNPKAHNNLAFALSRTGKIDDAIAHYLMGLTIDEGNANAHFNLGKLYLQKGALDLAIREFDSALRINPEHPKARDALRFALERKEKGDGVK